jgi:hypothetical protein
MPRQELQKVPVIATTYANETMTVSKRAQYCICILVMLNLLMIVVLILKFTVFNESS